MFRPLCHRFGILLSVLIFCSLLVAEEKASPPPYGGFVTQLFDGHAVKGMQFTEGVAPVQSEGTLLVTDVQPQQEAWMSIDRAVADFDLWVECYSEKTEYGNGGSAYSFSLYNDTKNAERRWRTWGIPAISGTAERPAIIHISRRGQQVVFRSAVIGEKWRQDFSTTSTHAQEDRMKIKFDQPWGSRFHIRKITLGEPGFKSLFNGSDLTGWEGYPNPAEESWSVSEGKLHCNGVGRVWLRSKEEYGYFNLSFDYKLNAGGNSGLFIRVPADGNHHRENDTLPPAGLEIQLLDDADEKYQGKLKDYQYCASVYDIVGASPRVARPAGEWNTFQIDAHADRLQVWHNGIKVVDADESQHPLLALRLRKGFLGLQNHASVIS
ncbi:MAG: DUF1080 domain-containing protein, partial [Verrucomicrobiae bacterium]|nr:DUF1080 domain-containing protein [Verrucomicrobiae bacterium]